MPRRGGPHPFGASAAPPEESTSNVTIKKLLLHAALALGLPFALSHAAQAQNIVSVNFTGSPNSTDGDPSFLSFDQQAGVVPAFNFNNADGFTNGQINTVVDNTGTTVPGLAVSYSAGTEGTNGPATTPNQRLLDGYLASSGGTAATTTVSGLPANFGTYNLYVYLTDSMSATAAASTGTYTFEAGLLDMNGVFVGNPLTTSTQTAMAATSPSDTFTLATATRPGNYLLFSGLSVATFQLSATSASGMAPINGFQIVGAAPVPESSTVVSTGLLLALSGALVLSRRCKASASC